MVELRVIDNIILRELQESDAPAIALHANNKKIFDNMRDFFPFPYTTSDALKFIEHCNRQVQKTNLTISVDGISSGMIGGVIFSDVSRITAEMGYWLGEELWGKGVMTACIPVFTRYLFSNFAIERIQAPVFEYNKGSMRVLEKSGFALESILKRSAIKNNKIIDQYLFVLFREQ